MTSPSTARTVIAQAGHARSIEIRLELATAIRTARRDAGLSARQLARAGGLALATIQDLESATRDPGIEVIARVASALGGRLRCWIEPGTGVSVHDRHQAHMVGALTKLLHRSWTATLEVSVSEPVRGVIDLVLERTATGEIVAVESESRLLRIEQQIRWASAKADALAMARTGPHGGPLVSRLLLLRSTPATRAVVATYRDVLAVAYPGRMTAARAALEDTATWPGPTLLWCTTDRSGARMLERPPRGIDLGT